MTAKRTTARKTTLPKPNQDITSRLGRRIRRLREAAGYTQTAFALRLGVDRSFLSNLERGRVSCRVPMVEVIAMGLKISLSDLFDGL
jgi:transcriptional regulator with XRE-family HTH domain